MFVHAINAVLMVIALVWAYWYVDYTKWIATDGIPALAKAAEAEPPSGVSLRLPIAGN